MDAIYSTWFKTDTVSVEIELEKTDDFLTKQEIAELTGAPKNSHILVRVIDRVIVFRIRNEIFSEDMYRYLTADIDGLSYYLTNAVLVLKEEYTNKGIGPRCVVKELHAARRLSEELGLRCVKVDAVGDFQSFHWGKDPLRGYYVWACMGFDAEIPQAVRSKLSETYRNGTHISELMQDKDGRKEWLQYGESVKLEFDLADNSVSWSILSDYMKEKGIEL